uniref:Uncharacterized protein n=1 Tax=Steinernema glaseri TaxID=37863 RepID=A0A1I8AB65_9BILA
MTTSRESLFLSPAAKKRSRGVEGSPRTDGHGRLRCNPFSLSVGISSAKSFRAASHSSSSPRGRPNSDARPDSSHTRRFQSRLLDLLFGYSHGQVLVLERRLGDGP